MKLVLLDPVSGDPITQQVAAGDPALPVLENVNWFDRFYRVFLTDSSGQAQYNMQGTKEQKLAGKVDDIEGAVLSTLPGETEPGPITFGTRGLATLTVTGFRGSLKAGRKPRSVVIDTLAIEVV
jgi:hypothetical protein